MTGGIGFSRQAQQTHADNRSMLKKKAPFQRIQENPFINAPKPAPSIITPELIGKLREVKKELATRGALARKILFVSVLVIVIFYVGFLFSP